MHILYYIVKQDLIKACVLKEILICGINVIGAITKESGG